MLKFCMVTPNCSASPAVVPSAIDLLAPDRYDFDLREELLASGELDLSDPAFPTAVVAPSSPVDFYADNLTF